MNKVKNQKKNNNHLKINREISKSSSVSGSFQQLYAICVKFLKTSIRDKPMYFWVFGYPLLFMLIYLIAFGDGGGVSTYNIAFINNDSTEMIGQDSDEIVDFASILLIDLFNPENDNNLSDTFVIVDVTDEITGVKDIQGDNLDALIIIPANFSEIMFGSILGNVSIKIITSPNPTEKEIISNVIYGIINSMILQYNGVSPLEFELNTTGGVFSVFDYMMPGIVIAGLTVAIMNVAQLFAKERESGLMERLDTTPVPRSAQLLGGGAAQMIFSMMQGLILLLCLIGFGVSISETANWTAVILIMLTTSYMCIGLGLIIASLVRSADSAGGISWVAILPLQFFGGTIMNMGDSAFNRIFPTYYSVRVMRNSLIDGLALSELLPDIALVFLYGTIFIVIALIIFSKKMKI
ncbi:MAG: ABC transporter permease [archaeon]|nr:ABC transporter permease [archaeon]